MSIFIKGMEMPAHCGECPIETIECRLWENFGARWKRRHPDCPLVEIPTPHGRLIDKDKLRHELFVNFNGERIPFYDCDNFPTKIAYRDLHSILVEQKTVIEAEGRETE